MKNLSEHLETVRAKPPHIRKQVAFATAFGLTALIALLWFGVSLSTGVYEIQNTSFADAGAAAPVAAAKTHSSSLIGAVISAFSSSSTPPHVEVVSSGAPSAASGAANGSALPTDPGGPTVIPF